MATTNLENPSLRNKNLDLIKLISCFAVVILHCLYTPEFETSRLFYQLFAFAVPCFFISSGYVLLNKRSVRWSYVWKKLLGIARIVLIWNTVIYGIDLIALMIQQGVPQVDYALCLKNYVKYTLKSVFQQGQLWQFWYLGAMGVLYLLLPIAHRYLCRRGKLVDHPRRGWVFWILFLSVSVAVQAINMITGHPIQSEIKQTFRLWSTIQFFLLGGLMPIIIHWISSRWSVKLHLILAAVLTVLTLAWRLLADHLWIHGVLVEYYYDDLPTILWIAVGFSGLMRVRLSPRLQAIASHTAPLIMGVYILHVPIRNLIRNSIEISGSAVRLTCALIVCLISFLCSYVIRKLPFGKYLTEI